MPMPSEDAVATSRPLSQSRCQHRAAIKATTRAAALGGFVLGDLGDGIRAETVGANGILGKYRAATSSSDFERPATVVAARMSLPP